jgi:hypothetical protein
MLLIFDEEFLRFAGVNEIRSEMFVNKLLQCRNCKRFGHLSNVCRRNKYVTENPVKSNLICHVLCKQHV